MGLAAVNFDATGLERKSNFDKECSVAIQGHTTSRILAFPYNYVDTVISQKIRASRLSAGKDRMTLASVVKTQFQRVTDR